MTRHRERDSKVAALEHQLGIRTQMTAEVTTVLDLVSFSSFM
jgi:hypothetical protein